MSECAQTGRWPVVRRLGSATFLGDWFRRNEWGENRARESLAKIYQNIRTQLNNHYYFSNSSRVIKWVLSRFEALCCVWKSGSRCVRFKLEDALKSQTG